MIIDKALQLSDAQAVTASAASTNTADMQVGGDAYEQLFVVASVDTAFAGGTSLTIAIETSDDSDFSSAETLISSGAVAVADLTKGAEPLKQRLPLGLKRYVRGYYTVSGTMTAGKINLNMAKDVNI